MNPLIEATELSTRRTLSLMGACCAALLATTAGAAVPGITGPAFRLTAQSAYITQPDGKMLYSWGYGCDGAPNGFLPAAIPGSCGSIRGGLRRRCGS